MGSQSRHRLPSAGRGASVPLTEGSKEAAAKMLLSGDEDEQVIDVEALVDTLAIE